MRVAARHAWVGRLKECCQLVCVSQSRQGSRDVLVLVMRKRILGDHVEQHLPRAPLRSRISGPARPDAAPVSRMLLSDMMKRDWAAGKLSSIRVQEYAAGSAAEGNASATLQALAKAGARGAHPQNAQRVVMRTLCQPLGSPDMCWANIPVPIRIAPSETTTAKHIGDIAADCRRSFCK